MTTGHRVTCEELVRELPDFLDRELVTIRLAELQEHLDECARCLRKHTFERAILDQIRARLTAVSVPAELEARVRLLIGPASDGPLQ